MALVHLSDDIKSEFSVNEKGEASITLRGCSRLINVAHQALSNHFGGNFSSSKLAKNLTEKGFEGGNFFENGISDTAFVFICEYYAFDAGKRCTKEAKNLYRAFAAIGFRTWVQKELGWEPKKEQQPTGASSLSLLKQTTEALNVMAGELIKLEGEVQSHGLKLKSQDFDIRWWSRQMSDIEKRSEFLESSVRHAFKASKDAQFYLEQIEKGIAEDVEVAELTTRAKVRKIALSFAAAQNIHPRDVWRFLYRQFRDRYHYDAKKRSRNSGLNPLGQVEADGMIEEFYNMTVHCLIRFPSFGWWHETGEMLQRDKNDFDLD